MVRLPGHQQHHRLRDGHAGARPDPEVHDGTAQQSTNLTGVDLFDDDWHDIAIYTDGSGNWYAIVDGTFYGPHSTNVPNDSGTVDNSDFMYPHNGILNLGATSAGTYHWATSYNAMFIGDDDYGANLLTGIQGL